jgi:hypothetical protein
LKRSQVSGKLLSIIGIMHLGICQRNSIREFENLTVRIFH